MRRYLLVLFCLCSVRLLGQSLETDRLSLVAIYNATSTGINDMYGGPNFNDIIDWNVPGSPGDSPCGWTGITCEGGRVTRLDLSPFQVHGPLAPEVGNLSELKYLNVMQGGFELLPMTGALPVTLGNLQKLEYLEIRGNAFPGTNMEVIGSLTKLKFLALNTPSNWTIPASFQNLVNLEYLYFDLLGNEAWPSMKAIGGIPSFFANYTNLKELRMLWAGVTGAIPSFLGNLANLEVLDLHHNYLTGQIPASFNNLTGLTLLDLSENQLTGPIPNILGIPVSANVKINDNAFNFGGIVPNLSVLNTYSPQAPMRIYVNGELPPWNSSPPGAPLSVRAGGTLANNTYRWYVNDILRATNVGDSSFLATRIGTYRVEVSNSEVPSLILRNVDFEIVSLPVTLVSFSGKSESGQTKLTWKTTSETTNQGFEIQRGADARSFEKIAFVDGNGDTRETKNYHFTDMAPLAVSYYRLKQLDYDGKFEYSKVIAVKVPQEAVNIYPNPAQRELTVTGAGSDGRVSVYTNAGRPVMRNARLSGGKLNVNGLKEGIYTIRIGDTAKKLLIQR